MRKCIIVFFCLLLQIFHVTLAKKRVHSVASMCALQKAKAEGRVNKLLCSIFDKKSSRDLFGLFGVFVNAKIFKRKSLHEKIGFLREKFQSSGAFPLVCCFENFPRKKKQLAQLLSFCLDQKLEFEFLDNFCDECFENVIGDTQNVKSYKIIEAYLSKRAKGRACRLWLQKYGKFLQKNETIGYYNLHKYFGATYDADIKLDLILFLKHFACIEAALHRVALTGWELKHDRFVVGKEVYQSLKLLNYIWKRLSPNLKAIDAERIRSRIAHINRLAIPEGIAYRLSKFWYDLKGCCRIVR